MISEVINLAKRAGLVFFIALQFSQLYTQDPRERYYMYSVLDPSHENKPKVDGWASYRIKERLDRGLIAYNIKKGEVYLSWRMLESDPEFIGFNIYRSSQSGEKVLITNNPITQTTDFIDKDADKGENICYSVVAVINGIEQDEGEKVVLNEQRKERLNYKSIKFQGDYMASKIAVADLNGDGAYDYIIKQPQWGIDPGRPPDKSGTTYKIEAYLSDGTFLWCKDLGQGIEPGVWYSPYVAYDFDGDGKAEIAVKTTDDNVERDSTFRVRTGPEYVNILDGMTGEEKARADWPPRSPRYGDYNRNSRNQIGIAYLDGKTPCLLVARGTYRLMVLDAYTYNNGELKMLWHWDGDEENPIIRQQGAHSMHSADVDNDGRDEVILGSVVIDDNGTVLWSTGYGHPDRVYVSDIDPKHYGMEIFYALEVWHDTSGVCLVDAKTGKTIWDIGHKTLHVGDGMVADIIPEEPGLECFASEDPKGGSSDSYLFTADGKYLSKNKNVPGCKFWMFWDGDLLREQCKGCQSWFPAKFEIIKYNEVKIDDGFEGRMIMVADILGDWREEIITTLPGELRIYSTAIPAKDKRVCLMQDPVYRADVAHRSMGYDQSPVTGYYLGEPIKKAP
ncbi:MAG: silent information regulator protein Sir2 [Bacteroidales bacterium]|nr:silent information regulator protein Sir2 [Bacteroidales bacterium]